MTKNKHIQKAEPNTCLVDKRSRGWFWDFNEIFDLNLSSHAIIVRIYIAKCANNERQAWPSLKKIGQKCRISKPTVIKALKELEDNGLLEKIIRRRDNNEYATTIYVLKDPPPIKEENNRKGGGKVDLPPVKNDNHEYDGVVNENDCPVNDIYHQVNEIDHLVNEIDYLVNTVDTNKTHRIRPNDQEKDQQLVVSLQDTTNTAYMQSAGDVVEDNYKKRCDSHSITSAADTKEKANNKCDSHLHTGVAKAAANESSAPENSKINKKNTQKKIADLTKEYQSVAGVDNLKNDYSYVGSLYNRYGYDHVSLAIKELAIEMTYKDVKNPKSYMRGIISNLYENKEENKKTDNEQERKKNFLRSLYTG